ncbi:hypothetical protein MKW94_015324, partial [Papaver nudicaule]|nr:hypothetical protein [Papaver nudicaule]
MRVQRMKHHRRHLRFYTTCFGFREPYKIFSLTHILGKPTKLFTTRCVISELHSLGKSYSQSFEEARNLSLARLRLNFMFICDHEKRKGDAGCIQDVSGENNSEHFFLETQDYELRKRFREIPGVPLINGLRKSLILDPPSKLQNDFVRSSEEQRSRMTEMEKALLKRGINKFATEDENATSDAHEASGDEGMQPRDPSVRALS